MDARTEEFLAHVQSGGLVETGDWMPNEYRKRLTKFVEMHANSELMGVLPERDWILRAPTLQRKLALTAKIQDEAGHAQLLYRIVHYPTKSWGDVGVIAWLVDAAAIISQKALLKCSYAPYARIMRKICWEESFHILHGRDVVLVQEALDRWWEPLMMFHGNPIPADDDPMVHWRIKSQANEEARQQFLEGYVPQVWELGLTLPDPKLERGEDGIWAYTEPDWEKLQAVVSGRAGLANAGSGNEHGGLRGVPARAGRRADAARGIDRRAGRALRRGLRARAVRPPGRVDGALARAAGGGRRDRGLRRRVRPQVPPSRRVLDQGTPQGGT